MNRKESRGDRRQSLALAGEAAAEEFLNAQGMRTLARRFRRRTGEIDLILEDSSTLVFVEVKTRSSSLYGRPFEAVNHKKIRKIADTALWYLVRTRQTGRACRFDVVEVLGSCREDFRIVHLRDAFRL